jgi:replicative DNA helicase
MNAVTQFADPIQDERFLTEVELLGALLSQPSSAGYHATAAIIGPEHFSDNFNARVFARIADGIGQGLQGFPLTAWLISSFRDDDTLAEMKWPASAMVARYCAMACPAIGIEGWARQIRHDHLKVALNNAVEEGDTASAETIAAEMERLSKAHLEKDHALTSLGITATAVVDRVSDLYAGGEPQEDQMAYPGSARMAEILGGFRRGRLYVIGGRPGSGKTTTGLSLLLRTAGKGHGVLFFELEMQAAELTEMAVCDLAWSRTRRIEYRDLNSKRTLAVVNTDDKMEALVHAGQKLNSLPFVICDRTALTIADIRSLAMQHAQRLEGQGKRLDVICIDHLNLVRASARYSGNKVAETEEVSNALKALAKELNCAVVALCQLSRGVEGRDDKRPSLADLRWTGAIEQDADVVMFVYREAYYLAKKVDDPDEEKFRQSRLEAVENKLEIIIAKHRGGPTTTLEMFTDIGCGVVRDAFVG